jgi:hypothetical protein
MGLHRVEVDVDASRVDVVSVLCVRPATWLRGFLRLAVLGPGRTSIGAQAGHPWYRLGVPRNSLDHAEFPLTWWPHVEHVELFQRFEGCVTAVQAGDSTILRIEGIADGGTAAVTDAVFTRLLTMIGAAITAESAGSATGQTVEG